ncbi:hypothetical protein JX266_014511, partial [Neoarthrinium moseri]
LRCQRRGAQHAAPAPGPSRQERPGRHDAPLRRGRYVQDERRGAAREQELVGAGGGGAIQIETKQKEPPLDRPLYLGFQPDQLVFSSDVPRPERKKMTSVVEAPAHHPGPGPGRRQDGTSDPQMKPASNDVRGANVLCC